MPAQLRAIRIGLTLGAAAVQLGLAPGSSIQGQVLEPGGMLSVAAIGAGKARLTGPWGDVEQRLPLWIQPASATQVQHKGRCYGGLIEVLDAPDRPGSLTVVERVPLEDYLRGVVPGEIKASWHSEALRCQAVAARTYACANLGRRAAMGFDLMDTVSDQVYGGIGAAHPLTDEVIRATEGVVMTWQDKPIEAYFHSSSGGETDDGLAVWGVDLPYLRGTVDMDASPNAAWQVELTPEALRRGLQVLGLSCGVPERFEVATRTPHGRARWLTVTGNEGAVRVDANKLRLALGWRSTRYTVTSLSVGWRLDGGGWGHGLGMSQWGAKAFAEAGMKASAILERYYPGARWTVPPASVTGLMPLAGR
jgi:stage II sporulation protein D